MVIELTPAAVPQVHAHAVAVDDGQHGVGQPPGDLAARPGRGQGARQLQQSARLVVALLGLHQGGGAVKRARRVPGVDLDQLALLGEEGLLPVVGGEQAAVVAALGAHRHDQPRGGQGRGVAVENARGGGARLLVLETLVVTAHRAIRIRPDGQQISRGPHLDRRAVGDPGQYVVDVSGVDQVGGGGEHAAQTLAHRLELLAQRADGLAALRATRVLDLPGDPVTALRCTEGGALIVLDAGRRQPEQHRRLGEQAASPAAVVRRAREALNGGVGDLGQAGRDLGRLHQRQRTELARGGGDLAVHALRGAERAQQRRHRGGVQSARGVLSDRPGEIGVVGDLGGGPQQGERLVVGDPVRDLAQVLDRPLAAGRLEHGLKRVVPAECTHARDQRGGHRAGQMVALGSRATVGHAHDRVIGPGPRCKSVFPAGAAPG